MALRKYIVYIVLLFIIGNMTYLHLSANDPKDKPCVKLESMSRYEINPDKTFGYSDYGFISNTGISLSSPSIIHRLYPGRSSESGIFLFFLSHNVLSSFSFRKEALSDIFLKNHSLRQNSYSFPPCKYFVFALRKIII